MASTTETGHSVNISNFKLLIDKCAAFGALYNPSNADITILAMTNQWKMADGAHQTLTMAIQTAKTPVYERQNLFEPVEKLVTRTLNYFTSTKASMQAKGNAKGIADRFRGYGIKSGKLSEGAHVSTSHQSYVQKEATFRQLVDLYQGEPLYIPNEVDLQVAALVDLLNAMKGANDAIGVIIAPVEAARIARDRALYEEETGIVSVAQACKNYVKGVFGATARETKIVTAIKFTR